MILRRVLDRVDRVIFPRRMRKLFAGRGFSFVSQNCIGMRFSQFANDQYRSPTIGLWFPGDDFTRFASDLPRYLSAELVEDQIASAQYGHPVGRLEDIRLMLLHYPTFDAAKAKWDERRKRVELERVMLLATDKNGATDQGLSQLDRLPYPKLIFTARPRPELRNAVVVPRGSVNGELADLYGKWHFMAPHLSTKRIAAALASLDVV